MNEKEKKNVIKKINKEIEKTKNSIIRLKELTKPITPDCAIGRISRMDVINNKTINENVLCKATTKLNSLKVAIQDINNPDFGNCLRCKNGIPLDRILLMPQSRFCVYCAGK